LKRVSLGGKDGWLVQLDEKKDSSGVKGAIGGVAQTSALEANDPVGKERATKMRKSLRAVHQRDLLTRSEGRGGKIRD